MKVQYRSRKITEQLPQNLILPSLVNAGMDRIYNGAPLRKRVGSRIFEHPRAGMTLLNRCDENDKWVFGELAVFAPGEHIPVIQDAGNAPMVDLAHIETPMGHHPLKGVLYWMAIDNHLLAIQTPNMSLKTLADYLNWLIHFNGISPEKLLFDAFISVENDLSPPVKDIVLRTQQPAAEMDADVGSHWDVPARRSTSRTEQVDRTEISGSSRVTDILTAAAFGEANIQRLRDLAGPNGEIILELHLKIKRERRLSNFQKADALALISDLDEDEVTLRGANGRHVGKLMKLTYDVGRVKTKESLIDPDDAKRVLQEAYISFCTNGYIDGPNIGK